MGPPAAVDTGIAEPPQTASKTKVTFTTTTLASRPDLKPAVQALCDRLTTARPGVNSEFGWPNFLYRGPGGHNFFDVIFGFPQYQTLVIAHGAAEATQPQSEDGGPSSGAPTETLAAVGYAAPCVWDGKTVEDLPPGWDHVILTAKQMLTDPDSAPRPNSMSALAVEVDSCFQGRGLSKLVLTHMKQIAVRQGSTGLLAPIRPIIKPQYPLVDMEDYVAWRLPDPKHPGQQMVFDPWLRTHIRLGASILKVARGSCIVTGSLADWHDWTGLHFLSSGPYALPGGLVAMQADVAADRGTYAEDNVWVSHVLGPTGEAAAGGEKEGESGKGEEGEEAREAKRQRCDE